MANLTITAANVRASAGATISQGVAGATITAGQAVYLDEADGKLKLAQSTSATAYKVAGVALHGASDNQPLTYVVEDDDFTPGATLNMSAAGDKGVYMLSATAGAICPAGDLANTNRPVFLFVAKSTTKACLRIRHNTGVALSA
jgi:hypothetical protein